MAAYEFFSCIIYIYILLNISDPFLYSTSHLLKSNTTRIGRFYKSIVWFVLTHPFYNYILHVLQNKEPNVNFKKRILIIKETVRLPQAHRVNVSEFFRFKRVNTVF